MSAAYDRDRLVELFGDDLRTLAEVEREFVETVRAAEREIAGTDDLAAIARAAHRLKGASGMIGAGVLFRIAEGLERAAKASDRHGLGSLCEALGEEAHRVAGQAGAVHV